MFSRLCTTYSHSSKNKKTHLPIKYFILMQNSDSRNYHRSRVQILFQEMSQGKRNRTVIKIGHNRKKVMSCSINYNVLGNFFLLDFLCCFVSKRGVGFYYQILNLTFTKISFVIFWIPPPTLNDQ